jgi:hypothetical protein
MYFFTPLFEGLHRHLLLARHLLERLHQARAHQHDDVNNRHRYPSKETKKNSSKIVTK